MPPLFAVYLTLVGARAVDGLLKLARDKMLGGAILGFSLCGLAMIIGSHAVVGWWQIALLGFGTSLLFVGTVQLGIVGVIDKLTKHDGDNNVLRVSIPETATSGQVAALLRQLAAGLDGGGEVAATEVSPAGAS
jgi:hypothetical protein